MISYCVVCGDYNTELHHIITKGSRPDLRDEPLNHMSLCRKHHREAHDIGLNRFYSKYATVRNFLEKRGFFYDDYSKKWLFPER